MPEEEKLGTEVIESGMDFIAEVIALSLKAMEDGKISVSEGFQFAFKIPKAIKFVKSGKEIVAEFKDIDADEASALLAKAYAIYQELTETE